MKTLSTLSFTSVLVTALLQHTNAQMGSIGIKAYQKMEPAWGYMSNPDYEREYESSQYYYMQRADKPDSIVAHKYKSRQQDTYKPKGDVLAVIPKKSTRTEFTSTGKPSLYKAERNGSIRKQYNFLHDEQMRMTGFTKTNKKGIVTDGASFKLNSYGKAIRLERYDKGGVNIRKFKEKKYNNELLVSEHNYAGKNEVKRSWVEYSYDEEGKPKEIRQYKKNGKLRKSDQYDCNNEMETNQKDTTKICINFEVDENGNRVEIERGQSKPDKMYEMRVTYDKDDNILKYIYTNHRKKSNGQQYAYNEAGQRTMRVRSKNGKAGTSAHWEFDAAGRELVHYWKSSKGEVGWRTTSSYNDAGQLLEQTNFRKDVKLKNKTTYTYDKYGNLASSKKANKKGDYKEHHTYAHNERGDQTEKQKFNGKDKLVMVWKTKFEYTN